MSRARSGARFVELSLELDHEEIAQVAVDLYHVCAVCGSRRTRLRFDDSGRLIERLGDEPCYHLVANLTTMGLTAFR